MITVDRSEYLLILKCLHPDNSASTETRHKAFILFRSMESSLLKVQAPRPQPFYRPPPRPQQPPPPPPPQPKPSSRTAAKAAGVIAEGLRYMQAHEWVSRNELANAMKWSWETAGAQLGRMRKMPGFKLVEREVDGKTVYHLQSVS